MNRDELRMEIDNIVTGSLDVLPWKSAVEIESLCLRYADEKLEEAAQIADRYAEDPYTSDTAVEAENIRNNILLLKSEAKNVQ